MATSRPSCAAVALAAPPAASEDRNTYSADQSTSVLHVALAARGERGSQLTDHRRG